MPFSDPVHGPLSRGTQQLIVFKKSREQDVSEAVTRALLSAIVESSDDAIISKNLDGIITSWNKGAERIFGYTADEAIGQPVLMLIPPDRQGEEPVILARLRRGERVDHFETVRRRKNGELIDISLTISPIRDESGEVIGASKVARDITERRRTDEMLRDLQTRYALSLEEKIQLTTSQLSESREKLRVAERMASLGTLSAGLGHDMGNVLMPLRAHVEMIARHVGDGNGLHESFQSIRKSIEYLQTLAGGLRLLAMDPELDVGPLKRVKLSQWWLQNEPLLRTTLGRNISLEDRIPEDLPPIAIAQHLLTQAIFNLVQNASQALSCQPQKPDGFVRISAEQVGDRVRITVADNGPGMTEEVKERCLEPYFTTKTRGISTGLGLTLVHGIVQSAKGSLTIQSRADSGTKFIIELPVAEASMRSVMVWAGVQDDRLLALVRHLLGSAPFHRVDDAALAQLAITDSPHEAQELLQRYPALRCILLASSLPESLAEQGDRVVLLSENAPCARLRDELHRTAASFQASGVS